ncbi:MAG TPA: helix-turn-helix domain-containing protein [Rhodocyclaceae bacterium]|uniref:helix-turn-helix domain-containing protein n=1 Tax=Accumulibacter sp. TaxID=2053492 RepID=UPI002CAF2303|nr:helix-turn-helix domain-containing protein [Accumulibacter sp.]HMZ82667.1 helix-turn-helix domain-containing protein [Rhodocyclaceae bacterium]HNA02894.1 helix-turn-helix domain-containing protein [Rhodocyclaceae bacterium]HNB77348.1 helix-turn-helix domain-containing protein [Rhodocyclaceae bacterium]HNC19942.1 helix-turn-helix domain-containing protein [Accumulibacter sp.]HNF91176.1 helix-turn-helix domain-containing protein [Accumulibacter sp.]
MSTSFNISREALIAPITAMPGPAADLSFPRVGTVRARVLAHFLDGRSLTHNEALQLYSTNRLAAVVFALGELGWAIGATVVELPTADGRIARIAEYAMSALAIEKAGDAGSKFVQKVRALREGDRQ